MRLKAGPSGQDREAVASLPMHKLRHWGLLDRMLCFSIRISTMRCAMTAPISARRQPSNMNPTYGGEGGVEPSVEQRAPVTSYSLPTHVAELPRRGVGSLESVRLDRRRPLPIE